jgi:5-methylcytosine-specific restriction endonuclease McrA
MDTEVRIGSTSGDDCTEQQGTQGRQVTQSATECDMGASCETAIECCRKQLGLTATSECVEDENEIGSDKLEEESLTPRELRVLRLFRKVKAVGVVASTLGVSIEAVRSNLKQISKRLGTKTPAEILAELRPNVPQKELRPNVAQNCPASDDKVTGARLLTMIENQEYRCALSGIELEPDTAVLDHKIPRKRGGKHELSNVWWLHRDVNRAKGTMTVDEFRLMCSRVAQWGA